MLRPVWLALFAAACASGDRPPELTVDTLDDGTLVVRNAPDWSTDHPAYTLQLLLRIGETGGSSVQSFGRVCDVARGAEGLIYVLDCLSSEVRVFDPAGNHVRAFGGAGDGPGEFRGAYAIAFDAQGRLWVAQETGRRYTVFANGEPTRTVSRPIRWPVTTGVLRFSRDNTLHEYGWWSNGPGGVIRMAEAATMRVRDTVALPAWDVQSFPNAARPQIRWPVPFSARNVVDVGPDGSVWTGLGTEYRLARIGPGGDTLQILELRVSERALSDADRRAAEDSVELALAAGFEADRGRIPRAHAYFTSLVIADDGELWVRRGSVYDIFDSGGRYRSTVPAPVAETPSPHIGATFLLGVERDENDVDYVELYEIVRPRR